MSFRPTKDGPLLHYEERAAQQDTPDREIYLMHAQKGWTPLGGYGTLLPWL